MQQVVVITGGSAGIGRAAARAFAAKGFSVGLIARGAGRLEAARAELQALGVPVHAEIADVADADALERAADAIEAALGPVTVWVNNAMATVYAPIRAVTAAEVKRVTEVTYLGAVNGTLTALKRMRSGSIVQVSSVLAWRAMPVQGAYCGAKFALRGFTEALRSELIHDRSELHLTMVHLPAINTPQFDWARNKTGRQTKAPGPYQPEIAADAIVFAATHKRRDVFVGRTTPPTILVGRLLPGVIDHVLARGGYSQQLGAETATPSDGNLFEPAAGREQGSHGRFDSDADSGRDIYSSRQADAVAGGDARAGSGRGSPRWRRHRYLPARPCWLAPSCDGPRPAAPRSGVERRRPRAERQSEPHRDIGGRHRSLGQHELPARREPLRGGAVIDQGREGRQRQRVAQHRQCCERAARTDPALEQHRPE